MIAVELDEAQWGLVLRALEYRYDPDPDDPEYRAAITVGVKITDALESAYRESPS